MKNVRWRPFFVHRVHFALYTIASVDFPDDSDGETSLSQVGGLVTKAISTVEKTAVVSKLLF